MENATFKSGKETALALGIPLDTLRQRARAGTIPCLRLNRRVVRFDVEAVRRAFAREANDGQRFKTFALGDEDNGTIR